MDAIAGELLKHGIPGVVILALLVACWKLWAEGKADAKRCEEQAREVAKRHEEQLKIIHDERVADQKAMNATLVRITGESVAACTQVSAGSEATKDALNELKTAINDDTRRRSGR